MVNHDDSDWLSHPADLITSHVRIIGDEDTPRWHRFPSAATEIDTDSNNSYTPSE